MKPNEFLAQLDDAAITGAIAAAELQTSGEVRVYVSHRDRPDVLAAAQACFTRLKMEQTAGRNGVLIYFAPIARKFAVVGDAGVHEKAGSDFWDGIAKRMSDRLRAGDPTAAVVGAVRETGELLGRYFPRRHDDRNELPDAVERGAD